MERRQVISRPLSVSSYASKGTGLRASVVGSSQARLQLGCSPVEDGMRSGKRRIAASATIEGSEGCVGGSACIGLPHSAYPLGQCTMRERVC